MTTATPSAARRRYRNPSPSHPIHPSWLIDPQPAVKPARTDQPSPDIVLAKLWSLIDRW